MTKASVTAALRQCAPDMRRQFDKPTDQLVAECLVEYDALGLSGFSNEMVELRAMKDPVSFAIQALKGK
jgi:hypothetical protein